LAGGGKLSESVTENYLKITQFGLIIYLINTQIARLAEYSGKSG
jgi:hypothetical protein